MAPDHIKASLIMRTPASPFARLPVELLRIILSFLPDVASLRSAVLSSSRLYYAFRDSETAITSQILFRQISSEVVPEALLRLDSAKLHGTPQESIAFLQQLSRPGPTSASTFDARSWTLTEALPVGDFHSLVSRLAHEFIVQAGTSGPPGLLDANVSYSELRRIQQVFYRFEIYRNAFPLLDGEQLSELEDHWGLFFSHFAPWENEQLGCIHDFLVRFVLPSFSDVAEHDILWGVAHVDYDTFDSPWIQHILSLGLAQIARIASAETYEDRYRVLNAEKCPDLSFDFLRERLTEANRTYDNTCCFHEQDPGPEEVWTWAYDEEHTGYWVYQEDRDILRKWGYVMWDKTRLDHVGLFQETFEEMDAKRDHQSERNEITRHEGYMSNSWEQRERISSQGGKGGWGWGDGSRLVSSNESPHGIVSSTQSQRQQVEPQSLDEAREFLRSMTLRRLEGARAPAMY